MKTGGGKLVALDEPTVVAKPLLDPIVVENSQGDGGLANSASTNERNWDEVPSEIDNLRDQLVAPKEGPRWRGRGFCRTTGLKYEILGPLVV